MDQTLPGDVPLRYTTTPGPEAGRPPVLLLHGFGSTHELNWERTGWPHALRDFDTIGVDLRGHGGSGRPHDPDAYLPAVFAADLVRLLDALEVERVDVLAYSMGSRLAWELALTHPNRVRRAVLAGFGPHNAFADTDLDRLDTDPGPFAEMYRTTAALPGNDPEALAACARGQAAVPFTAEPAPHARLLYVAGEDDALATDVEWLASTSGGTALRLPGRDHRTAVSARAFKKAVVEFLSREYTTLSAP